uniref:FERM domain-containing protein n=1 Tax=Macrostomum lignano TaxID=282301 RepID=A0A1I8GQM6_9PLAT
MPVYVRRQLQLQVPNLQQEMSRIAGLQKLSVAYLRVYRFHSTSAEQSDYLVKLEKDPRTLENSFVVYYAVLRAHRLFLFSNDSSQQCKDVVNLEQCTVRDTPLDKQWPACCNSGCQIWLPGCSASGLGAGAQVPAELACCWQLGFFSGSKWKRALEAYAKLKGPAEPVDITDSEYDND